MLSPRTLLLSGGLMLSLAGCHHREAPTPTHPHYVVGKAWQGDDSWFYPSERFDLTETGLAIRQIAPKSGITADGEVWSPQGMTGAHQTLQLPAIISVRNLTNGRIVRIRLNDRGPQSASRTLGVTPRVADLLGMGSGPVPVEIVVDEAQSRHIADSSPDAPKLEISSAPREAIVAQSLDDGTTHTIGLTSEQDVSRSGKLTFPEMPQTVMQGQAENVVYHVLLGTFSGHSAASQVGAQCAATVALQPTGNGTLPWQVTLGPFTTVQEADRAFVQAHRCGSTGARIVAR